MATSPHDTRDEQTEQTVGNLLRVGVILAATVVLTGGVLFLVQHGGEPVNKGMLSTPASLRTTGEIVEAVRQGSSRGIIQLGLVLLIATPVARVVFSVFAFLRQRDYAYVGWTLIVLAVLIFSFFFGHLGA